MRNLFLCIEILGESPWHKALNQSGYSGRCYLFFYNRLTRSHIRAYRDLEDYRAERLDMHKAANVWPLIPNLLEAEKIEAQCWIPERVSAASRKASDAHGKNEEPPAAITLKRKAR